MRQKTTQKLPAPETGIKEMQNYLNSVYNSSGLPETMGVLHDWEFRSGYINKEKYESNPRFKYIDPDTGTTYRAQVNIARSRYSPKPVPAAQKKNIHCPICIENAGIAGKETLRVFRFDLNGRGREFFLQLTPFPLFRHHFVLINMEKVPQKIDKTTLSDMFDFLDKAPTYTVCSNSDVEWAGASILSHMHYQVFDKLELPVMEAPIKPGYTKTEGTFFANLLDYPIAVIRCLSPYRTESENKTWGIIDKWKNLSPGKNTVNLTLRKIKNKFETHVILRNPDFRTPKELTGIKSEGVGIIEVSGEGIYPLPEGPEAEEKWDYIKNRGLELIKGIINGNNPVKKKQLEIIEKLLN